MDGFNLTAFDAAALAIIIVSAIMALARGLLREVFSIVAFIGAALAAIYGFKPATPLFAGWIKPDIVAQFVAAIALFLVVFTLITLFTSMLAKAVHSSSEIGALDRGAGLVFGVARGVLVIALFVLLMRQITGAPQAPMPDWLANARLFPAFERVAVGLEAVIPRARDYIREKGAPESGDADAAKGPAPS